MMEKSRRQTLIRQIVQENAIANQSQLVERVRQAGIEVTQASISRDIREIGLVKLKGRYTTVDGIVSGDSEHAKSPLSELITCFEPIGANLIVLHTEIGAASSVGAALDEQELKELAACIAGDDTLFLAVRSRSDQGRLVAWLRGWTGHNGRRRPTLQPIGTGV